MRILLQFPEGLKQEALSYASKLEGEGNEVVISASPAFGGCDLAIDQARAANAEKIIAFGHAEYPLNRQVEIPVEFVEYRMDVEFRPVLEKALEDERFRAAKKVSLITTVQHLQQLPQIQAFLETRGKEVLIGKPGHFCKYPGQILGCDVNAASSLDSKVDCHLYVGGGIFHPIGAAIACKKPLISCDPFSNEYAWLDEARARYFKRRNVAVMMGVEAKKFGIIVSVKPGQFFLDSAKKLKEELEKLGKEAHILTFDHVSTDALVNFRHFDFYVNTACPRLVVDDYLQFDKPTLNMTDAFELVQLLKGRPAKQEREIRTFF